MTNETSGDRLLSTFASEQEAYDYSVENRACVYDDDHQCVFCSRWDH